METTHDQTEELAQLLSQEVGEGPHPADAGTTQDCTTPTAIALLDPSPEVLQILETVTRIEQKIDTLQEQMSKMPAEPSSSGGNKRPSNDDKTTTAKKPRPATTTTPFDGPFKAEWINIPLVVRKTCGKEDRIDAFEAIRKSAINKIMEFDAKKEGNHEWAHLIPGLKGGPYAKKHKKQVCFHSFGCKERGVNCPREHLCTECAFIADKKEVHKYNNKCQIWRLLHAASHE